MKKTQRWIALFCALAAFSAYADNNLTQEQPTEKQEHESQSLYDSIKSGWNKMLDAVVGPADDSENTDN